MQRYGTLLGTIVLSFFYSGWNLAAQAQSTLFADVTLAPQFSPDPMELQGIAGGTVTAKEVVGQADTPTGPCVGFVDRQPDHNLVLQGYFSYLNLQVTSPDDTTLVISGPGGTWCNDDFQGKNPGIAGEWLPGTYKVWVGSYAKGRSSPYRLRISETR